MHAKAGEYEKRHLAQYTRSADTIMGPGVNFDSLEMGGE